MSYLRLQNKNRFVAMWPEKSLLELLGISIPIVQAPMSAASDLAMAIAVSKAGGLGSLPCGMKDPQTVEEDVLTYRRATNGPVNVNFFCHSLPSSNSDKELIWKKTIEPYYKEYGVSPTVLNVETKRRAFDDSMCKVVEKLCPEVVSFHFGLPTDELLNRVKASGAIVIGCATTVEEAQYLESKGCDAVIAQGNDAGGHRGMFLSQDVNSQVGTFSLLPQIVDVVSVPVIAAGGIADGRGIAAAFMLGAAGVQIGTAYLLTQESTISDIYQKALLSEQRRMTALTNLLSGKPARGIVNRFMAEQGPISAIAPDFPLAGDALAPIKSSIEQKGLSDFSSFWSGQAGIFDREKSAFRLTKNLAKQALKIINPKPKRTSI